jgi:hypothetical protein
MSIVRDARRVVVRTADAATAVVGAVGGAAVTGVIGAVEGTAAGVRNGLRNGSHSTTTAALTLAAIGVAGVVDWPILVAVGGGALAIHQLSRRMPESHQSVQTATKSATARSPRAKRPARKAR